RTRERRGPLAGDLGAPRAGADDVRGSTETLRARGRGARAAHDTWPAHADLPRSSRRAAGAPAPGVARDRAPVVGRAARGAGRARAERRHRRAGAGPALTAARARGDARRIAALDRIGPATPYRPPSNTGMRRQL